MESYSGKTLGNRYEVGELLGEGGMAVVYKAFDPMENRVVAVKILKDEFLANEEFSNRFKNESKAIAILSHPNIVKVYDVFFSERLQYIVMEYIEGITLKEYIKQQKIVGWKEAVHFTTQILRALQHAHDKGIVHRDIKPQNIMVLQNGNIKVADFGIARFSRGETQTITENGAIGSVHYISPEQARGELTDAQADIYSVGVVLYEMITGRLPFDSESAVSVALMQVQAEPVRPRDINPMIPIGLEQICIRAMQKDKSNRYQTASEMLLDLDEFKRNPSMKFDYGFSTITNAVPIYSAEKTYSSENDGNGYNRTPSRYQNEYGNNSYGQAAGADNEEFEDSEDAGEDKKNVVLPVLIGVFSALIVGIILVGVFVLKPYLSNSELKVPNFIGQKYEDVLKNYPDFKFEDPPIYVYNKDFKEGEVCEQSEKEGTKIKKNTVIRLSVASGEGTVVEDVAGYQYSAAQEILKSYGFVVTVIPEKSATVKEGEVIRTDPAANSVAQYGSVIKLYVATKDDSAPVKVPDLIGKTKDQAIKALEEANLLQGNITEEYDTKETKGKVIKQDPQKDTEIAGGSSVNFVISKGEEENSSVSVKIKLPYSSSENIKAVAYLNGVISSEENVKLDGKNISFSFTGKGQNNEFKIYLDTFLLCSGTIDFSNSSSKIVNDYSDSYTVKKTVPYVCDLSLNNAKQILTNSGFTNIMVLEQETSNYNPGIVISQSPSDENSAYDLNTQITLVVAKAVPAQPTADAPENADD